MAMSSFTKATIYGLHIFTVHESLGVFHIVGLRQYFEATLNVECRRSSGASVVA